jgi:hypothetical protein
MAKDKRKKSQRLTTDEAIDRLFGKHAAKRLRAAVTRLDAQASRARGKKGKKDKRRKKGKNR